MLRVDLRLGLVTTFPGESEWIMHEKNDVVSIVPRDRILQKVGHDLDY